MEFGRERSINYIRNHLAWSGVVFVFIYWVIESAAHSFFFDGGPLLVDLFYPDIHELWMRLIVVFLLITFGLYGQNIINRLRRTELAVIEREKEAQRILEYNPAAIILVDCETRKIVYANGNALSLIGTTTEHLMGKQCHNYLCESAKGSCPILDLGQPLNISERDLRTEKNTVVPVLKSATQIQYKGKPHLLEAFFDVTEQRQMQTALQQAHAELDQIFQTATVGMRLIDHNFNIMKINQSFAKMSGVDAQKAIGKKCYDVFAGTMCQTNECSLKCVLDGREFNEREVEKRCADGSVLTCNVTVTPFHKADGTRGVVEAFQDISELKKVQDEILSERDRLHRILFHQFESIGIINSKFILEFQNEVLKRQTAGMEECCCYQVFRNKQEPCRDCLMIRALETEEIQRFEFDTEKGLSFEHTYTPFIDNDGQGKVLVSSRDITERKASEAAAMSSERLASLGELAAGVAHEINNPINGIINYGQILANREKHSRELVEISRRIISEGDRIAAIVASLLSFARRDNDRRSLVNIKDLLNESLFLTGVQLKKDGIKIAVSMAEDLPAVLAVGQEIQQVFLNVINNSRYALNEKFPENDGKKQLDIEIKLTEGPEGELIQTIFTDYGIGIPSEILNKASNPFFSTKPKGKGTGLGLTICERIITNHGGELTIDSELGQYTRVVITLSACRQTFLPDMQRNAQDQNDVEKMTV